MGVPTESLSRQSIHEHLSRQLPVTPDMIRQVVRHSDGSLPASLFIDICCHRPCTRMEVVANRIGILSYYRHFFLDRGPPNTYPANTIVAFIPTYRDIKVGIWSSYPFAQEYLDEANALIRDRLIK